MVNSITSHGVVIIYFLFNVPVHNIDGQINFIIAEVRQDIGRAPLMYLVKHGYFYIMCPQKCGRFLGGIQRYTQGS